MKQEKVIVFITTDNQRFENKQDAIDHENQLIFETYLENYNSNESDRDRWIHMDYATLKYFIKSNPEMIKNILKENK